MLGMNLGIPLKETIGNGFLGVVPFLILCLSKQQGPLVVWMGVFASRVLVGKCGKKQNGLNMAVIKQNNMLAEHVKTGSSSKIVLNPSFWSLNPRFLMEDVKTKQQLRQVLQTQAKRRETSELGQIRRCGCKLRW